MEQAFADTSVEADGRPNAGHLRESTSQGENATCAKPRSMRCVYAFLSDFSPGGAGAECDPCSFLG